MWNEFNDYIRRYFDGAVFNYHALFKFCTNLLRRGSLLVHHRDPAVLVLFFCACIVCAVFILRLVRSKWRWHTVHVVCWFCHTPCRVPRGNRDCWDCPTCEQYNGFTSDGDYNKAIPAQRHEHMNHGVGAIQRGRGHFRTDSDGALCEHCQSQQALKVVQLAQFEPMVEANFETELAQFRARLERSLALCARCEARVERRLRRSDLRILPQYRVWQRQREHASRVDNENAQRKSGACSSFGLLALLLQTALLCASPRVSVQLYPWAALLSLVAPPLMSSWHTKRFWHLLCRFAQTTLWMLLWLTHHRVWLLTALLAVQLWAQLACRVTLFCFNYCALLCVKKRAFNLAVRSPPRTCATSNSNVDSSHRPVEEETPPVHVHAANSPKSHLSLSTSLTQRKSLLAPARFNALNASTTNGVPRNPWMDCASRSSPPRQTFLVRDLSTKCVVSALSSSRCATSNGADAGRIDSVSMYIASDPDPKSAFGSVQCVVQQKSNTWTLVASCVVGVSLGLNMTLLLGWLLWPYLEPHLRVQLA